MKKTALTLMLCTLLASPASSMIESGQIAKDIIVTADQMEIDLKDEAQGLGTITIQQPRIDYKVQKGTEISEPLTSDSFVSLWSKDPAVPDNFGNTPPNTKLICWDQDEKNYYETDFVIESATIDDSTKIARINDGIDDEVDHNKTMQLQIKFLTPEQPIRTSATGTTTTDAKTISLPQFKERFSGEQASIVLVIGHNPSDPRA